MLYLGHSRLSSAAGSHRLPQDSSPCWKSCVGQSAKDVILDESAETQVPNIERALFIFKNATPLQLIRSYLFKATG